MVWGLNNAGLENILVVDNLASTEKWRNLVNRRYTRYMHRAQFLEDIKKGKLKERPKAIIHLGACSSTTEKDADFLMSNNTDYSLEVCKYALENGARLINASSAATFGDGKNGFESGAENIGKLKPLNMYGYSKHLVDLWLKRNKLLDEVASLKFFNVYGPNEYHKGNMASVVLKGFRQINDTGSMRLFKSSTPLYADGGQMRDFVYVKDCVALMLRLLKNPRINGILDVGTGRARSWNELAAALFHAMNVPGRVEYIDMPAELAAKYQNYTQADMAWIEKALPDFAFHSLEDGVNDYVRNYLMSDDSYLESYG